MNPYSFKLIHDRPNQRLRLVRISNGNFSYSVLADIPLDAPVQIRREDGGQMERAMGRRTMTLMWGDGDKERVSVTAGTNLSVTLEDESTLVKLDSGSAYNFNFVAGSETQPGDHLEQMIRRIIRQSGFLMLGEGLIDLDDGTVKDMTDITVNVGGATMDIPDHTIGVTMSLEAPASTDYVRFTMDGDDPAHATFNGNTIFDREIVLFGKTPGGDGGDASVIPGLKFIRNTAWSGDGVVHIVFWGLQ